MSEDLLSSPNVEIQASRRHLKQALDAMDLSDTAFCKDGASLFCREGQLVIRQGYTERSVVCDKCFSGQFSVSFTSLQKWRRAQKAVAGDELLQFVDSSLNVCRLLLPTKWNPKVDIPTFAVPKVVPPEAPVRTVREDARFFVASAITKTCGSFRLNVDREELQDALSALATAKGSDIQLRTWGGKLILSNESAEHRVDAEGKIDGFSVIPVINLAPLINNKSCQERFVNLICEKHELKILGARVKTPRKAAQYEEDT